ncbi:MAG: MFS transporter [Verrucomicrobiales bacterium]
MRPLKNQFFLSFAVVGSLVPLMSVFLSEAKGLQKSDIGTAMSLSAAASVFSALMALLADTRGDARRILALCFDHQRRRAGAAFPAAGPLLHRPALGHPRSHPWSRCSLQDATLFFSAARAAAAGGEPAPAYPAIRVWGTIGYIVPSIALFIALRVCDFQVEAILYAGIAFALLSVANTFFLPGVRAARAGQRLGWGPTKTAFRTLLGPRARPLILAIAIAAIASTIYHSFFGLYVREEVGLPPEWVGVLMNIGVFIEIFFTLLLPWLLRRLGMKYLIAIGFAAMATRLFLLAAFPGVAMTAATQIGHGIEIMAMFVVPVMFLDRLAGDEFRNSIQGCFAMFIGVFRVGGSIGGGHLAEHFGLRPTFALAGALAVVAILAILIFFRPLAEDEG